MSAAELTPHPASPVVLIGWRSPSRYLAQSGLEQRQGPMAPWVPASDAHGAEGPSGLWHPEELPGRPRCHLGGQWRREDEVAAAPASAWRLFRREHRLPARCSSLRGQAAAEGHTAVPDRPGQLSGYSESTHTVPLPRPRPVWNLPSMQAPLYLIPESPGAGPASAGGPLYGCSTPSAGKGRGQSHRPRAAQAGDASPALKPKARDPLLFLSRC